MVNRVERLPHSPLGTKHGEETNVNSVQDRGQAHPGDHNGSRLRSHVMDALQQFHCRRSEAGSFLQRFRSSGSTRRRKSGRSQVETASIRSWIFPVADTRNVVGVMSIFSARRTSLFRSFRNNTFPRSSGKSSGNFPSDSKEPMSTATNRISVPQNGSKDVRHVADFFAGMRWGGHDGRIRQLRDRDGSAGCS